MVQLKDFTIPEDDLNRILRSLVSHAAEYQSFLLDAGNTRATLSDVAPDSLRQHLLDTLDEDVSIRKQACIKKLFYIISDITSFQNQV